MNRAAALDTTMHVAAHTSMRRWRPALGLALGAALLALLLVIPRPATDLRLDVGAEGPFRAEGETALVRNMFGFHAAELDPEGRTYRWTAGWARLVLSHAYAAGDPLLLDLVVCGCLQDRPQQPLEVRVDQRMLVVLPTTAEYRRYRVLLPSPGPRATSDLYLELLAPLTPVDRREIGVRVDSLRVVSMYAAPLALPTALGLALAVALAAAVCVARAPAGSWLLAGLAAGGPLLVLLSYTRQDLPVAALMLAAAVAPAMVALARPARVWCTAALTGLALALVWLPGLLGGWLVDDAFISFRYAQQLVAGHGLVFNPGERVEGYTNFLWTVMMAAVLAAGGDAAMVARLLNLLLAQGALVLAYALGRQVAGAWADQRGLTLVAPLLVASSASFGLYGARGSGMETTLFALLLLAGALAYVTERYAWCGVVLALAAMTRPEGVMVLVITAGHRLLRLEAERPGRDRWRRTALLTGMFLALFLPYYLWRSSYYGLPLPNTFYVKVGASSAQVVRGLGYLADYWREAGLAWPMGLAALAGMAVIRWRPRIGNLSWRPQRLRSRFVGLVAGWPSAPTGYLVALALVYSAYIVAVGGDWMPGARFVAPIVPLLALVGQLVAAQLARQGRPGAVLAITLLVIALGDQGRASLATRADDPGNRIWYENYVVGRRREVGLWIAQNTPPDTLVAVEAAGALPYYSGRPALDILGLNDRHIASADVELGSGKPGHEKTDIPYVLDRRPGIIPYFALPYFENEARFQAEYTRTEDRGPEGRIVILYRRVGAVGAGRDQPRPPNRWQDAVWGV